MRGFYLGLLILLFPYAAHATTVSGAATAIDGDTLVVNGAKVRLFGIDAPELAQPCRLGTETWACGEDAKAQLEELLSIGPIICSGNEKDTYGRLIAVCSAGGFDLNRTMVAEGWATAYRSLSDAYIADEVRASAAKKGIWRSEFDLPQNFRVSRDGVTPGPAQAQRSAPRRTTAPAFSGGCVVKGNRNRRGEWIYHIPGMPYYDQTRPEEIFCSEAEARRAGYRRAIVR